MFDKNNGATQLPEKYCLLSTLIAGELIQHYFSFWTVTRWPNQINTVLLPYIIIIAVIIIILRIVSLSKINVH